MSWLEPPGFPVLRVFPANKGFDRFLVGSVVGGSVGRRPERRNRGTRLTGGGPGCCAALRWSSSAQAGFDSRQFPDHLGRGQRGEALKFLRVAQVLDERRGVIRVNPLIGENTQKRHAVAFR